MGQFRAEIDQLGAKIGALCTSKSYWRPFWLLLGTKWALEKQKKLKKFKSIGQVFGNFDNRAEPLKSDKNGNS